MKNGNFHWPSAIQFFLSVIVTLMCWGVALILVLGGAIRLLSPSESEVDFLSITLLAAGAAMSGFLFIPSAAYALLRLLGKSYSLPAWLRRLLNPNLLILFLPVTLLFGYWIAERSELAWLILPFLHVLAVGLPILWLAYLGWRGLPTGTPQRAWGVFGSGLLLGPAVIMVFEMLALGVLFILGMIYISLHPEMSQALSDLQQLLPDMGGSPEDALSLVKPYLTMPIVIFTIFSFVALIVPLIEEIFKPIGAWLLVWKNLSPAEGFTAGLLSGTGYALFENLALTTINNGGWLEIVILRMGTGLLHIITAALTGWAMAMAWGKGRYIRLALTYLVVVLIHGAWNGLAVIAGVQDLALSGPSVFGSISWVSNLAYIGMAFLTIAMFLVLIVSNSLLRRGESSLLRREDGFYHSTDQ